MLDTCIGLTLGVLPQYGLGCEGVEASCKLRNAPFIHAKRAALLDSSRVFIIAIFFPPSLSIPIEPTLLNRSVYVQQVMLRVFFFFATFGEALSQTAQAFIPGQLARERNIKAAKTAARAAAALAGDDTPDEEVSIDPRLSPARTMMR